MLKEVAEIGINFDSLAAAVGYVASLGAKAELGLESRTPHCGACIRNKVV